MKRVVILGSTGSIGAQTLDVIRQHPDRFQVVGLAANSNESALRAQSRKFGVDRLVLSNPKSPSDLPSNMVELATCDEVDIVVVCVAGVIGLLPTIAAIKAGKQIALASKEVLVAAGEVVMPLAREHGVTITPIDSEHSAIFQCLQGYRPDQVAKLILTASGGPFRGRRRSDLKSITVQQALDHPTWKMGGKITIDSATLMNKGLETIEAKWLFGVEIDQVETVIHPQSVIHSMVKLSDGSALAQLGWPNMRLPILYALSFPERISNNLPPWNPIDTPNLTFEEVDHEAFPSIGIAKSSVKMGGTAPCAMNAANEEAANAFLRGEIPFLAISDVVGEVLARHERLDPDLDNLIAVDTYSREIARNLMQRLPN
jgi:1-deoxy-D-xylulose-5-phosphate reductoisomerase